jgi:hypothetical protein
MPYLCWATALIGTMFSDAVPGSVIRHVIDDTEVFLAGHIRRAVLPDRVYRLLPGSRAYLRTVARLRAIVAWAIHLIGQHPGLERRLHAEVDSVLPGRPATYQDLGSRSTTTTPMTPACARAPG